MKTITPQTRRLGDGETGSAEIARLEALREQSAKLRGSVEARNMAMRPFDWPCFHDAVAEPPVRGAIHRLLYVLFGIAIGGFVLMPAAAAWCEADGFVLYCALVGAAALTGAVLGIIGRFRR